MIDGLHRWPVAGGDCAADVRGGRIVEMYFGFARLADPESPVHARHYAKFNPAPIRVDVKATNQNAIGITTRAWIECAAIRLSEVIGLIFSVSPTSSGTAHDMRGEAVAGSVAEVAAARFFDLRNMAMQLRATGGEYELAQKDRDFCQWLREVRVEPLANPRSNFTWWGDPSDYSRPYAAFSGPSFNYDYGRAVWKWTSS